MTGGGHLSACSHAPGCVIVTAPQALGGRDSEGSRMEGRGGEEEREEGRPGQGGQGRREGGQGRAGQGRSRQEGEGGRVGGWEAATRSAAQRQVGCEALQLPLPRRISPPSGRAARGNPLGGEGGREGGRERGRESATSSAARANNVGGEGRAGSRRQCNRAAPSGGAGELAGLRAPCFRRPAPRSLRPRQADCGGIEGGREGGGKAYFLFSRLADCCARLVQMPFCQVFKPCFRKLEFRSFSMQNLKLQSWNSLY